ncbi:MAG: hypothetical protein WBC69_17610, partial [Geitlerinemataceae cyanobacterium]
KIRVNPQKPIVKPTYQTFFIEYLGFLQNELRSSQLYRNSEGRSPILDSLLGGGKWLDPCSGLY